MHVHCKTCLNFKHAFSVMHFRCVTYAWDCPFLWMKTGFMRAFFKMWRHGLYQQYSNNITKHYLNLVFIGSLWRFLLWGWQPHKKCYIFLLLPLHQEPNRNPQKDITKIKRWETHNQWDGTTNSHRVGKGCPAQKGTDDPNQM